MMDNSHLHVGTARADITPPVGIAHANWGAQAHERAAGVDMELWATALAVGDGTTTAVIVDLDLVGLQHEIAREAVQAAASLSGLAPAQIRLAYTHTHSGPSTSPLQLWVTEGAEMVGPYLASLPSKIAGVVWEAVRTMQPARLAAGTGECRINVNRRFRTPEGRIVVGRNKDGPVDHTVQVVRFDSLDEQPIAIVVHYACHPTIVGPYNDQITPDYPGVVKRVVEKATGARCLFLQGAAGNAGPILGCTTPDAHAIYRRLGAILGYEAVRVALTLETLPRQARYLHTLESGAPLAVYADEALEPPAAPMYVATRTIELPLRDLPPLAVVEAEAQQCSEALQRAHQSGAEAEIRQAAMQAKRSRKRAERTRLYAGRTHDPVTLQAIILGAEVALVGMPGEPFVEIGQAIKERSPFRYTLFSGYSSGGPGGYLPVPSAYPEGGYEAEDTQFAPTAASVVIEEIVALLHECAAARQSVNLGEMGR